MLFREPELTSTERELVARIEGLRRALRYFLPPSRRWHGGLRRDLEGREPGLDAAARDSYRAAMSFVLTLADDPDFAYSAETVRALHYMVLQHDLSRAPGRVRRGPVYLRNEDRLVREPPGASQVQALLEQLLGDLRQESSSPVWVRAAMAHLNMVLIHPFTDANGRMARCLESLILARAGIAEEPFVSLEEYLGRDTSAYYRVLGEVAGERWDPSRDARPWLHFCLEAHCRHAASYAERLRQPGRAAAAMQYRKLFREWQADPSLDGRQRELAWQARCQAELDRVVRADSAEGPG
ncbi:MAG TPA: Fic family protein [Polyangiaceae bacterium]|jgi:Fic family protein